MHVSAGVGTSPYAPIRLACPPEATLLTLTSVDKAQATGNGTGSAPAAVQQDVGERVPFVAPSFTTFTDMQDIILLDPVHEVDTRGWPHASAGA